MQPIRPLALALLMAGALPLAAPAQIPAEFRNLQVLPKDIERDSLIMLMRSFSFATGLLCQDCHVAGPNGDLDGARYDLDDKPAKRQARHMIAMVNRLNDELLADMPGRDDPPVKIECKTCHRGLRKPLLLRTELRRHIDEFGIASAVERYRELRERRMESGAYDFGIWEMNELARQLVVDGKDAEAAAVLELNEEFHPRTPSIPRELGPIYERLGRTDDAIAAYRRALGLNPRDERSLGRLRTLGG